MIARTSGGSPLIQAVPAAGWAGPASVRGRAARAAGGLPALTLTTFAKVPWNAPYYLRCGFRVLDDAEVTAGLRATRQRAAAAGVDRLARVCMRRDP